MADRVEECGDAALELVDSFVKQHRQAAIPALLGACVLWACRHGGGDVVRHSLDSARELSVKIDAVMGKTNN